MLSYVFGAFGLSTLWLLPLLWRVVASLIRRRRPPTVGPGAIRFWTGFVLVLIASATLEGSIISHYTDDPSVGGVVCRWLAGVFATFPGALLTTVIALAVIVVALPWYLGVTWSSAVVRLNGVLEPIGALSIEGVRRLFTKSAARATGRRPAGAVRRADRADRTPAGRRNAASKAKRANAPAAPSSRVEASRVEAQENDVSSVDTSRFQMPRSSTFRRETQRAASSANETRPSATTPVTSPATARHRVRPDTVIREPWLAPRATASADVPADDSQREQLPRMVLTDRASPAMAPSAPRERAYARSSSSLSSSPAESLARAVEIELPATAEPAEAMAPPLSAPAALLTGQTPIMPASPDATHDTVTDSVTPDIALPTVEEPPFIATLPPVAPVSRFAVAANDEVPEDVTPLVTLTQVRPLRAVNITTNPLASTPSAVGIPPLTLLAAATQSEFAVSDQELADTGDLIEQRLREFKVPVQVVGASAGPVITRYEVEPAVGVRGNQIVALMKDLARGLGRTTIRVVETIPGKTCMGLELPNEQRQMIALSEILDSVEYRESDSLLTLAMGKGITGEPVVADLAKAPHMLVAGTTGSGKSVAVNAMILSMLYKATPEDVRMIMIDPKMLELSVYEGIPHLLAPVVTDMKLAANALNWCVAEMENRYKVMSDLRVRNLAGYNQKVREARAAGKPLFNPFPAHPEVPEHLNTMPMIVVIIDELADLMMTAGKKIEELIARLAQKARAAGIHLILATQRPSVDVITGLIKANIPTRVAFQVSSKIDSRTILDQMGAESLLGAGDMLFLPPGSGYPQRIHGAFVADEEVHRIVAWLKQFGEPDYKDEILAGPMSDAADGEAGEDGVDAELDPLYDEAAAFVLRSRRASISFVQRQFRIGYNRAARLVEAMEAAGLVSSMGINGQREVIAPGPQD